MRFAQKGLRQPDDAHRMPGFAALFASAQNRRIGPMLNRTKRRSSARRVALLAAAFGCTCASLSGALAAFAYSAQLESPALPERHA